MQTAREPRSCWEMPALFQLLELRQAPQAVTDPHHHPSHPCERPPTAGRARGAHPDRRPPCTTIVHAVLCSTARRQSLGSACAPQRFPASDREKLLFSAVRRSSRRTTGIPARRILWWRTAKKAADTRSRGISLIGPASFASIARTESLVTRLSIYTSYSI